MLKYLFVNRLKFSSNEICLDWMRRLIKATSPAKNVEDVFAFALYVWANEEGSDDILSRLSKDSPNAASENFKNEVGPFIMLGYSYRCIVKHFSQLLCL